MDQTKYNATLTREHLANERTFLAWQRTSIATMGFGILIARLNHSSLASALTVSTPTEWHVGILFVLSGLLLAFLAAGRYFKAQRHIESGVYEPNNAGIAISAALTGIMGLFVLIFLALVRH